MDVTLPNGKVIKGVPKGTSKEEIMQKAIAAGLATEADFNMSPQTNNEQDLNGGEPEINTTAEVQATNEKPEGSMLNYITEPLQAIAGSAIGSTVGHVASMAEVTPAMYVYNALTGQEAPSMESADKIMSDIQAHFQSEPDTQKGQQALEFIGKLFSDFEEGIKPVTAGITGVLAGMESALNPTTPFEPIKSALEMNKRVKESSVSEVLKEDTLATTGSPMLAKVAETLPFAGELITGSKVGAKLDGPKAKAPELPKSEAMQVVADGEKAGLNVLTTDVVPPKTFLGRHAQKLSEKLGALGSGQARKAQQEVRQKIVEDISTEFNIELDSPFFDEIIDSMSNKNARALSVANGRRTQAIDALSPYGDVKTPSTINAAESLLEGQAKLKDAARQDVVSVINKYNNATQGQDFRGLAKVRTELIRDIKDLENSTSEAKTSKIEALSKIKKAIDIDMQGFARSNDATAYKKWVESNKDLADQLTNVKQSELKRLIEKGETTPELVATILNGGKRSQLLRLRSSLSPNGLKSARAAVIRSALDKSGFFKAEGEANPNRFATELAKTNTKQAIDILFNPTDKKQLAGLQRLLDKTKRAQDASLAVETGASLIPWAAGATAGAGVVMDPITTLASLTTLSAVAKMYESKPFRNLLLRLQSTQRGSIQEQKILEKLIPSGVAVNQVATEEQQQTGKKLE